MGHVGVVVMLYDIGLMASLGDNMNLKTPLLSKPPQQGDAAAATVANPPLHLYYC